MQRSSGRVRLWLRRILVAAFFSLVAWLIWRHARTIDWNEVRGALGEYRAPTLLGAAALAALSYLIYGCFDVLSRRYVGQRLRNWRTIAIGAVSYAFNLNLGAIVGGAGFRLRMYSKTGLEQTTIAAIIAFSMATNWLGYLAVAGTVFAIGGIDFPEGWKAGDGAMRVIGATMVAFALTYVAMCRWSSRRSWSLRGREFVLPTPRMAVRQLLLGASNWLVIAAIVWMLLHHAAPYPTVLAIVCVASIAGAMTHIPGGLGVIEGVFLAMLGGRLGDGPILAALLAYRAVYYIGPLVVAGVLFLVLEAYARRRPDRVATPSAS